MKTLLMILSLLTVSTLKAENFAVKSSIKMDDCIVTEFSEWLAEPEIDFLTMLCPSFGNYQVEISGGDIRYNLKLSYKGKNIELDRPSGFHDMDDESVEWRYKLQGKGTHTPKFKYTSLVYAINFQSYDEVKEEDFNDVVIYVVKLDKSNSCKAGEFLASKYGSKEAALVEARKLADQDKLTCLK